MRIRLLFFQIGFILTLSGLSVGGFSAKQYRAFLTEGKTTALVIDEEQNAYRMPFSLQLDTLQFSYYQSGKTKQIEAFLILDVQDSVSIAVNHPESYHGYDIYLQKYLEQDKPVVQILLVRQPLKVLVYSGLILLILSSLWWLFSLAGQHLGKQVSCIILGTSALVIGILIWLNPMLRSAEVPPILRSIWFLPHIIFYILSYALLLSALWFAVMGFIKPQEEITARSITLFKMGTALFTIGLALGIIWAKAAWGQFWGWDPKESFALATWTVNLVFIHYQHHHKISPSINIILQIISFLCLQMCWYGVKLFNFGGLHVY